LDLVRTDDGPTAFVGSIEDPSSVARAMQGAECVVHLAAQAHDVAFEELLGPNVRGLYQVMNRARESGVTRVVLASTIQVVGRRGDGPATAEDCQPQNHYALTKAWAEQMGAMYARSFAMSVLCVRIAWMVRNLDEARRLKRSGREDLYLSPRDAGRFMALAVEAEPLPFAVVHATSKGGEKLFDMEPARRLLGYEPLDRFPEGLDFEFDVRDPNAPRSE
jgi:uronate dehydrogenase